MNIPELIDYLKDKSESRQPGKMGVEVYVKKKPLELAAAHLEDYLLLMEQMKESEDMAMKGRETIEDLKTLIRDEAVADYKKLKERDRAMVVKEVHLNEYYCPACGAEIVYIGEKETHKFCLNCGQRLNWSEEEEE